MPRTFDAIVVGNGALGAAIAFELARRGLRVARVGPRARRGAASTAAGAMLGCFGEVTRMSAEASTGQPKLEANLAARALWPAWDERLASFGESSTSLISTLGTTVILNSIGGAPVDGGNFAAIEEALLTHGEPFDHVDPQAIPGLEPNDLCRPLRAIHIPGEKSLNLPTYLQLLDKALQSLAGSLIDAEVDSLLLGSGACEGVRLANGATISSGVVILAAGTSSRSLLHQIPDVQRAVPPLFNGYGVSLVLKPESESQLDHVVRTPNRAFACGLHAMPRGLGKIYVGGTNVVQHGPRTNPTIRDLGFLLDCAVNQIDVRLAMSETESINVGNRPVSADGMPLIGPVGLDGLWMASGTYREGVGQSPLIADLLSSAILNGKSLAGPLRDFDPVRPPLQAASRSSIIAAAREELLAAGLETQWSVTPEWPKMIDDYGSRLFTERAEQLHDRFTPPAEILAKLDSHMRSTLIEYYTRW